MTELEMFTNLLSKDPSPGIKNRIIMTNPKLYLVPGWVFGKNIDYIEIKYKSVNRRLKEINCTSQILYDILILGLTDINQRPVCPICGIPAKYQVLSRGYTKSCGNKRCSNLLIKGTVSNLWKDSNYRNKIIQSHIDWAKVPNNKQKLIDSTTKLWSTEEYRSKQIYSHKLWASKEENLLKMRETSLKLWKDELYRDKQINSHIEYAKNHNFGRGTKSIMTNLLKSDVDIKCDSSWETAFIKFCDTLDEIIKIERANIVIPYNFRNKERSYYPDFILTFSNNIKILVEVKANWMIERDEKTILKINAGKEFVNNSSEFKDYLLLTEDILFRDKNYKEYNSDLVKSTLLSYM